MMRACLATRIITRVRCTPRDGGRALSWTMRANASRPASGPARGDRLLLGSGTEADNLAILGAARLRPRAARRLQRDRTSRGACARSRHCEAEGYEITLLPVDRTGPRRPGNVSQRRCGPRRSLASIMYANNEIGTVQPIAELARDRAPTRRALSHRRRAGARLVAARRGVRWASTCSRLSAHKFDGPKGVGAALRARWSVDLLRSCTAVVKSSGGAPGPRTSPVPPEPGRGARAGRVGAGGKWAASCRPARPPRSRHPSRRSRTSASTGRALRASQSIAT